MSFQWEMGDGRIIGTIIGIKKVEKVFEEFYIALPKEENNYNPIDYLKNPNPVTRVLKNLAMGARPRFIRAPRSVYYLTSIGLVSSWGQSRHQSVPSASWTT